MASLRTPTERLNMSTKSNQVRRAPQAPRLEAMENTYIKEYDSNLDGPSYPIAKDDGTFIMGNDTTLRLLRNSSPDTVSTVALGTDQLLATDLMSQAGSPLSAFTSNGNVRAFDRRSMSHIFTSRGLTEEEASFFSGQIFSDEAYDRELTDLGGYSGFVPGTQRGTVATPGTDIAWAESLTPRGLTAFDMVKAQARVDYGFEAMDTKNLAKTAAKLKLGMFSSEDMLEKIDSMDPNLLVEAIKALDGEAIVGQNDIDLIDENSFAEYATEANKLGITNTTARKDYIRRQAQNDLVALATKAFSGGDVTPVNQMKVLAHAFARLAPIVGPDVVTETMLLVTQPDFSREESWKRLPEDYRASLESMGLSPESFLSGREDITNDYIYLRNAQMFLQQRTGEHNRERLFELEIHGGWANWTRRTTDFFRTDIAQDPTALYFGVPTLAVGLGTGLLVKASTSVGRIAGYSALDGLAAGTAEGYAMSVNRQLSSFYGGTSKVTFDSSTAIHDALIMGAMGSIAGSGLGTGLSLLPGALGYGFRGVNAASSYVNSKADILRATGVVGEKAQKTARNRMYLKEVNPAEREAAESVASSPEEAGMLLRVQAEELSALEVAEDIVSSVAVRSENSSKELESLLNAEALAAAGVSPVEVVMGLTGIVRRLGNDVDIPEEVLVTQLRNYLAEVSKLRKAEAGVTPAQARINRVERGLKGLAEGKIRRFLSGSRTLNGNQKRGLKKALDTLRSTPEKLSDARLDRMLDDILATSDEAELDKMVSIVESALTRNLETTDKYAQRLSDFKAKAEELKSRSADIRSKPEVQKALRVKAVLESVNPEASITIARGLGVTPKQLMTYVNSFLKNIDNADALEDLRLRQGAAADAVDAINEQGRAAFEFNEAFDSLYSFENFAQSKAFADIVAYEKAKKAARRPTSDLKARTRRINTLRRLAKKIGIDLDQEEALKKVLASPGSDMNKMNKDQQMQVALRVAESVDGTQAGSLSPGSVTRDVTFLDGKFNGTPLGEKLVNMLSKVALWPQTQSKLFRQDNRIIRGATQLITGSHITQRNYSSHGAVLTIEGITEGARREALPYVLADKAIHRKLGRLNHTIFDQTMVQLRMRGKLLDGVNLEDMPPELIEAYKNFGGNEALISDMTRMNDLMTQQSTKLVEAAEDAGFNTFGTDPRMYFPEDVGRITKERSEEFIKNMVKQRTAQLLANPNTPLDRDVAASLGLIQFVSDANNDAMGKRMSRDFIVPEDSPFSSLVKNSTEVNNPEVLAILRGGMNALDQFEGKGILSRASKRKDKLAATLGDKTADLSIIYSGRELLGDSPNAPVPESAASNGITSTAAKGIAGSDPVLNQLEAYRSELALLPPSEEVAQEAAAVDSKIALRRRQLGALAESRFANDQAPTISRVEMSSEERVRLTSDDDQYSQLSEGHSSLVDRLDQLIANGVIDDSTKRVVMAAFADVDPSKLVGMSFVRLDVHQGIDLHGLASVLDDGTHNGAIIRLADISQEGGSEVPGHIAGQTFIHETAHAAFLSASPRLQRTFQALFEQARSGANDIPDIFKQFGLDVDRALENVHEFVAYLAQISLVSDKLVVKNPTTKTMLTKMKEYFVKLINDVFAGDWRLGEKLLPEGEFEAIEKGIKNIFAAVEDENLTDNLLKRFDLKPSKTVDPFGDDSLGSTAASRRKGMKTQEDVTADDIMNAQGRLFERFQKNAQKNPDKDRLLDAFTEAIMRDLFEKGWPTDDAGNLLDDSALFDLAMSGHFTRARSRVNKRGPGGDRRYQKENITSMTTEEGDLDFSSRGVPTRETDSADTLSRVDREEANEEIDSLIDSGLRSSDSDVRKAGKFLDTSRKLVEIVSRKRHQRNKYGGVTFTEEEIKEYSAELGVSATSLVKVNQKGGFLHPETIQKKTNLISDSVSEERKADSALRINKSREIEIEEEAMADPVIQREIAATSAGEVDSPIPGYTRYTTKELTDLANDSDKAIDFVNQALDSEDGIELGNRTALFEFYYAIKPDQRPKPRAKKAKSRAEEVSEKIKTEQEPEAPVRVEEPEVETPARAEDAGGEEPPAPPKAPSSAAPDPEPDPVVKKTQEGVKNLSTKSRKRKTMNSSHRLAHTGLSLSDLYKRAIEGDTSLYSKKWKDDNYVNKGHSSNSGVLDVVFRDYINHNSGNYKADLGGDGKDYTAVVGALSSVSLERTFSAEDLMDPEYGARLAELFAGTTSSAYAMTRMAENSLASIRIQKMLNDLSGVTNFRVDHLFMGIKRALENQAARNSNTGGLTESTNPTVGRDINEYMKQLQRSYIRARGRNPADYEEFSNYTTMSRIARNFTYSLLGGTFAMNVAFVEAPLGILRASGMNPLKIIGNTAQVYGSILKAVYRGVVDNKPLRDWMAKNGINLRQLKHHVEDMAYHFDTMQSSSMQRMQVSDSETVSEELMYTAADRARYHLRGFVGQEDSVSIAKRIEQVTGAAADMTGILGFMQPITDATRQLGANLGKESFLRHYDGLLKLAKAIGESSEGFDKNQLIGKARELGVPRNIALYAGNAGLLKSNGAVIEALGRYMPEGTVFGKEASPGRTIDLNAIQAKVDEAAQARRNNPLGREFASDADVAGFEAEAVPSLQEFIRRFTDEYSPELRGAQRLSGENPITDMLMSLLTYPMAAYQALVSNGVAARGSLMTAGILVSLTAFEFMNRNLKQALLSDEEEVRNEAIENLTTPPDLQKVMETIALYGTASPLFGAIGPYLRTYVGVPLLDVIGSDEKVFRHTPFNSPVFGTAKRVSGAVGQAASAITNNVAGDGTQDLMAPLAKLGTLGLNGFTPLNTPVPQFISQVMQGEPLSEKLSYAAYLQQQGQGILHPAYSHPALEDKSYFQPFTAASSPMDPYASIKQVPERNMTQSIKTQLQNDPVLGNPGASAKSAPLGPGSAGGNLADLLKK